MEVKITISAALRSEKTKKACRINQCDSFTNLCMSVDELENATVHTGDEVASFKCKSFGIVAEHSSTNWDKVFSYEVEDNLVKVNVKDHYVMGPIIPGYQ